VACIIVDGTAVTKGVSGKGMQEEEEEEEDCMD